MSDQTSPEIDKKLQEKFSNFLEKAVGPVGKRREEEYTDFVGLHNKAIALLIIREEEKTFGIDSESDGVTENDLKEMLNVIIELEKVVKAEDQGAILKLVPEGLKITNKGNEVLIMAIGGEEIESGKKKIPLKEALQIAKKFQDAQDRVEIDAEEEWLKKDEEDKETWRSISEKDREKLVQLRRLLSVVGLDPDSIATGKLGAKEFYYKDKETGKELKLKRGDRVVKIEPKKTIELIEPKTGKPIKLERGDSALEEYEGEQKKDLPKGNYVVFERSGREIVALVVEQPLTGEATFITKKGRKLEVEREERIKSVLPEMEKGEFQERSLRDLLIEITNRRAAELADAYLTTLQEFTLQKRKGSRGPGWSEDEAARGIVIGEWDSGSEKREAIIMALKGNEDLNKKWEAIATMNETNRVFGMIFLAKNRAELQKEEIGAKLARVGSADHMVGWMRDIPDLCKALSWEEWRGLRNPWSGEPLDYPAVAFGEDVKEILQERLKNGRIGRVIKESGKEISGADLKTYTAENGDIFILKPEESQHKSTALIEVMWERARFFGIERYKVDLAFAFHRFSLLGADKGISYNKAQIVGEYLNICDMLGVGEQAEENYGQLTAEEKTEFEEFLKQVAVYQTGVRSIFDIISKGQLIDPSPANQDKIFIMKWKDRAPIYEEPSKWVKKRISWGEKVDWKKEKARRWQYGWMADFMSTAGKGLMDIAGRFAGTETPFNVQNERHMDRLLDFLMSSKAAEKHFKRVGLDRRNLGRSGLRELIKQIFPDTDKGWPKERETNFLEEMRKFNETKGYKKGLEAEVKDFIEVDEEFREALKLEKVLEQPGLFDDETMSFVSEDGWTPNEKLIKWIDGAAGVVNETSYDRLTYDLLYWYSNYLAIYESFFRRRLGKETLKPLDFKRMLDQWQDQKVGDVRGTPWAAALHFANEELDTRVREEIVKGLVGHKQLEELFDKERFWQDAALFYDEPILDPVEFEKKVLEYCQQRQLQLHREIDVYWENYLQEHPVGLDGVHKLVDPNGDQQMYQWVIVDQDGGLVGRDLDGNESERFKELKGKMEAELFTLASELEYGSFIYGLRWESTWGWKYETQGESMDGKGLFKDQIRETWYGIIENDKALYPQFKTWYESLKDLPEDAWEKKGKNGKYIEIPQILVGFAREYLRYSKKMGEGKMDLRADDQEAEATREFFKKWLYEKDIHGYRNSGQSFNEAFQGLIGIMFALNAGNNGFREALDENVSRPRIPAMRYLYMGPVLQLIKDFDSPDKEAQGRVKQRFEFFDILLSKDRQKGETWKQFFEKNNLDFLTEKETIILKLNDLTMKDRMYSPKLTEQGAKIVMGWFGLSKRPDEFGFKMGDEIFQALTTAMTLPIGFNEPATIEQSVARAITDGKIKGGKIREVNNYIKKEFGLGILPRFYFVTHFFKKIGLREVRSILDKKLPPEKLARRWVYRNYGIDIGKQENMTEAEQAIKEKTPNNWEDYRKHLGKEARAEGNFFQFLFSKKWLDETFWRQPMYKESRKNLLNLSKSLIYLEGFNFVGALNEMRYETQNAFHGWMRDKVFGEKTMSFEEKVKAWLDLRDKIPVLTYTHEFLEDMEHELFGVWSRPMDTTTEIALSLEYRTAPLVSLLSSTAAKLVELGGIKDAAGVFQGIDSFIKRYIDAPLGASVVLAPVTIGTIIALGFLPALPWIASTYLVCSPLFRYVLMPAINKRLEKNGYIKREPQLVWMFKRGIIK